MTRIRCTAGPAVIAVLRIALLVDGGGRAWAGVFPPAQADGASTTIGVFAAHNPCRVAGGARRTSGVLNRSFPAETGTASAVPDVALAVGPHDLIAPTNRHVTCLARDGTRLGQVTTSQFWGAAGGTGSSDPWTVYDPYIKRFWYTQLRSDGPLVGLSDSSSAAGPWHEFPIQMRDFPGHQGSDGCDYDKIGFDATAIYVTCNMRPSGGSIDTELLRVITKSQFLSPTITSPPGAATTTMRLRWHDYWNFRDQSIPFGPAEPLQPAQMVGATAADGEYVVTADGSTTSMGSRGSGDALTVTRITNVARCCDGNSATTPNLVQVSVPVSHFDQAPDARQPAGPAFPLDSGGPRLLYAFWHKGVLSTGHTVACIPGLPGACTSFVGVDVSALPAVNVIEDLRVGGLPSEDWFYPSVAVADTGYKTMVFGRSGTARNPGAVYVTLPPTAVCHCARPAATLKAGGSSFEQPDGQGRFRWGDYNTAARDPDGVHVWIAGEYAVDHLHWGVWVGETDPHAGG